MAADAKRVASRDQGADGDIGDVAAIAQAAHLERVADGKTTEAQLFTQQAGHDPPADCRGPVIDGWRGDVRAHDRLHSAADRRAERRQRAHVWVFFHYRQPEV